MKYLCIRMLIAAFTVIMFAGSSSAQNPDSTLIAQQLKNSRLYYDSHIGDQSRLLNGIKYVPYRTEDYINHPFFLTKDMQNAYLNYDDADLYNIPVLYDLSRNMLVIKDVDGASYLSLLNTKLNKFIIANHTFIKILADSTQDVLKPGFYDLLYDGPTQLLVKREKKADQEKSGITIQNLFRTNNYFYVHKNDTYYSVSSKGDLLKLFKEKKKELNQYIKANDLSFGEEGKEQSMVRVINHYDQLTR
jgi:hypothetical protein